MFESLASCFTFRCSASLNSAQDESAVADMTRQWLLELGIWDFRSTQGWPLMHPKNLTKTLFPV
jgi:hypothetical protein